ncbi:hypothetical protein [Streptomyces sp. NPDC088925]|uniref:hypothetical protein n=1 Tax=Streptomyces sp. NPDC088925 TaxID=3365914 RepID=UPI0037F643F3
MLHKGVEATGAARTLVEPEHPAESEQRFRASVGKRRLWGIVLLIAAGLCWAWSAWHTFTPYTTDNKVQCAAPFHRDGDDLYRPDGHEGARGATCAAARDWQSSTVPLVIGFPLAVTGVGLFASAGATVRLRTHLLYIERAERAWARRKDGRP